MPGSGSIISPSRTASPFNPSTFSTGNSTPNPSHTATQPRRKPGVVGDLSDSLRDIGLAKSDRKQLYDAGIQETQRRETIEQEKTKRLQIREFLEVEKMRIQTEKDLELRRLALEERRIAIQERQMGIIPVVFTPPPIRQSSPDWETSDTQSETVQPSSSNWEIGNTQVGEDGKQVTEDVMDFGGD